MPTSIVVPSLGESVTSAILVQWLKKEGEAVAKDEPVCILETDKANVDLPAKAAGVLHQIVKVGETVAVGAAVGETDPAGKAVAAEAPQAVASKTAAETVKPQAAAMVAEDMSPAVRAMVQEHRLDAAALAKQAPGGRLTKEFLLSHLEQRAGNMMGSNGEKMAAVLPDSPPSKGVPIPPMPTPLKGQNAPERKTANPATTPNDYDSNGERRVKMPKIRQFIAKRLVQAQQTAAILTTFNEVDLSEVMALRTKYKETFEKTHGVGLGFMSFFARAVVMGLREFPSINAYIDGEDILYHQNVHLGIAVSTDNGLLVPVLKNVQAMSFSRIESEIKRMATSARAGKLGLEELSGGTFSITNGGVFGSLLSTPILNPPQSGILGMHTIQKRPVVINDKIEIRSMMYLALSYDHRIVDGKDSISFLVRVKQLLEDPARLLLEI